MELQKNLPEGIPSATGITPASVLLDEGEKILKNII